MSHPEQDRSRARHKNGSMELIARAVAAREAMESWEKDKSDILSIHTRALAQLGISKEGPGGNNAITYRYRLAEVCALLIAEMACIGDLIVSVPTPAAQATIAAQDFRRAIIQSMEIPVEELSPRNLLNNRDVGKRLAYELEVTIEGGEMRLLERAMRNGCVERLSRRSNGGLEIALVGGNVAWIAEVTLERHGERLQETLDQYGRDLAPPRMSERDQMALMDMLHSSSNGWPIKAGDLIPAQWPLPAPKVSAAPAPAAPTGGTPCACRGKDAGCWDCGGSGVVT